MRLEALQGNVDTKRTDDACSAVSNFVILTSRELYEELRDLVIHLHLTQNGCTVICYGDFAIGRDKYFIKTWIRYVRRGLHGRRQG